METALNPGMCRCCASEGAFKDIKSTYHWMGEEEVYADMLRECFDVILNASGQGEDSGICEVCITQLRNAINFKKQVLHTEEQFQKHLQNKTLFRPNIVKVEMQGEEESDDNMASGDEGFSGAEYEVPIKTELEDPKPKKRAAKAAATTTRASAKKAKADNGETSTKHVQLNIEEKIRNEGKNDRAPLENINYPETSVKAAIEKIDENNLVNTEKVLKITQRTDLIKHRSNIKEILLHSNATPIRRYGGIGYTCCYCPKQFGNPAELKKHTLESHKNVSEANFMKSMNMSEYVVKLDVTALKCKLCDSEMATLNSFIDHLQNVHEKNIYMDYNNHIFPFEFGNDLLKCALCSNTYSTFRILVSHMHVHYRNYICTICDAGFVNRNSLTQHSSNHKTGVFTCGYCPKVFPTPVKKRLHERTAHTHVNTTYKCGYCEKSFKDYGHKETHVASAHGVVSLKAICQACNKVFVNRKRLNVHIKKFHLMERLHKCTECEKAFYSTTALKSHIVVHTGSKEFQCSVCLKRFGRKKTLNVHMKTHAEKEFKCEHCDKNFTQKHTLRDHMRFKHHDII